MPKRNSKGRFVKKGGRKAARRKSGKKSHVARGRKRNSKGRFVKGHGKAKKGHKKGGKKHSRFKKGSPAAKAWGRKMAKLRGK